MKKQHIFCFFRQLLKPAFCALVLCCTVFLNAFATLTQTPCGSATVTCANDEFACGNTCIRTGFSLETQLSQTYDRAAFELAANGTFYVNWGDGNVTKIEKNDTTIEAETVVHPYTNTSSSPTIKFGGLATMYKVSQGVQSSALPVISFNVSKPMGAQQIIKKVKGSLGAVFPTVTSSNVNIAPMFFGTFANATNLTQVSDTLFSGISMPAHSQFRETFKGCTSLETIPDNLFASIPGSAPSMFLNTFNSSGLTSVNPNLFGGAPVSGSVVSRPAQSLMFAGTFSQCSDLQSIGNTAGLFSGVSGRAEGLFFGTFAESGLSSIPEGLFDTITGAATQMFAGTFANCPNLHSIPENLFIGINNSAYGMFLFTFALSGLTKLPYSLFPNITARPVINSTDTSTMSVGGFSAYQTAMFGGTFAGCANLGSDTSLPYIPVTLFANMNSSNFQSNSMQNIFARTNLAESCNPVGAQRSTGFESAWDNKVACGWKCEAGNYLPAGTSQSCTTCGYGYYCPGGLFSNMPDAVQGRFACSEVGDGTYTQSGLYASSENECYKYSTISCAEANPFEDPNGTVSYRYNSAQCRLFYDAPEGTPCALASSYNCSITLTCNTGYTKKSGYEPLNTVSTLTDPELNGSSAMPLIDSGTPTGDTTDLNPGEWKTVYDYGTVKGESLCTPTGASWNTYITEFPENTLVGKNCWCRKTSFTPTNGAEQNIVSAWVGSEPDYSETPAGCLNSCSAYCSSRYNSSTAKLYRSTLYKTPERCEPNTVHVEYVTTKGTTPEPTTCTYGHTFTLPSAITPTENDYTFGGWVVNGNTFSANETVNCIVTTLGVSAEGSTATITALWNRSYYRFDLNKNANDAAGGTNVIYEKMGTGWYIDSDAETAINADNPVIAPTRTGYTFAGYYRCPETTDSEGCEQIITADGETPDNVLTNIATDGTLYAKWVACLPNGYADTWNTTNKHISEIIPTVTDDNKCKYTVTCATGYDVTSYEVTATAAGTTATSEQITACNPSVYEFTLSLNTDDTTATFINDIRVVYEKFDNGWYTNAAATDAINNQNRVLATRDGYIFAGYYRCPETTGSEDCEQIIMADGVTLHGVLTNITPGETLFAKWTTVDYEIAIKRSAGETDYVLDSNNREIRVYTTHDVNAYKDNTRLVELDILGNNKLDVPANPLQWTLTYDLAYSGAPAAVSVPLARSFSGYYSEPGTGSNVKQYASNDGTITADGLAAAMDVTNNNTSWFAHWGDARVSGLPTNPTREGYLFVNWLNDATSTPIQNNDIIQENTNVSAQWGQCTANGETPVLDPIDSKYKVNITNGYVVVDTVNNNCQYTVYCNTNYKIANNPCASGVTWDESANTCTSSNLTLNTTIADCTGSVYDITLDNNGRGIPEEDHIYEKYNTGWYHDANAQTAITDENPQRVPSTDGARFRGYYAMEQTDVTANTSCTAEEITTETCSVPAPVISRASGYENDGGSDAGRVIDLPSAMTYSSNAKVFAAWAIDCVSQSETSYGPHSHCELYIDTNGYVTYNTWCDEGYTLVPGTGDTYNPQCTANSISLTWSKNTGNIGDDVTIHSGSNRNDTCDYGAGISDVGHIVVPKPTREGHVFNGWYITDDVVIYPPETDPGAAACIGAPIGNITSGSVNYKADWTANQYTVRFNPNAEDATGNMSAQTYNYDEPWRYLPPNAFERPEYDFIGWCLGTPSCAISERKADGAEVLNWSATQGDVIDLFAQWAPSCATRLHVGNGSLCLYRNKISASGMPSLAIKINDDVYYAAMSPMGDNTKTISNTSEQKLHIKYGGTTYNVHDKSVH